MICEMPIKGISISDSIVLSNSLSRLSSDFLKGGATGVLVGRLVQSANAIWLLSRAANSETIQEPNSETNNPNPKAQGATRPTHATQRRTSLRSR